MNACHINIFTLKDGVNSMSINKEQPNLIQEVCFFNGLLLTLHPYQFWKSIILYLTKIGFFRQTYSWYDVKVV